MEKYILTKWVAFSLPVLFTLLLSGCSDKEVPTPVNSSQSSMTAVVNGASWESSNGNYKLGTRTITNGVSAFAEAGDTLTVIGVQVQGTDTTAIMISVKLDADKVGIYPLRTGTAGKGNAYFLTNISGNALEETKAQYSGGITNGELQVTQYDPANYSVSGSFGFSMSAPGETTYTVISGSIDNVTF